MESGSVYAVTRSDFAGTGIGTGNQGRLTVSPSSWPCEGPLPAFRRALGRRVGRCGLVASPASRRLSCSGQRCTLSFDPELYVGLSVSTSIRRESLRERHLGRRSGINQLD